MKEEFRLSGQTPLSEKIFAICDLWILFVDFDHSLALTILLLLTSSKQTTTTIMQVSRR